MHLSGGLSQHSSKCSINMEIEKENKKVMARKTCLEPTRKLAKRCLLDRLNLQVKTFRNLNQMQDDLTPMECLQLTSPKPSSSNDTVNNSARTSPGIHKKVHIPSLGYGSMHMPPSSLKGLSTLQHITLKLKKGCYPSSRSKDVFNKRPRQPVSLTMVFVQGRLIMRPR